MWRNRILAAVTVGVLLWLMRLSEAVIVPRHELLYLVALPLVYGHLIGAALFARSRKPEQPFSMLTSAFTGVNVLALLAAYTWALNTPALQLAVLASILLLSMWHIVENDLELARSYRDGLRLGPVPREVRHYTLGAAWTVAAVLLALSTFAGSRFSILHFGGAIVPVQTFFSFDEVAAAVLLYHAISWIVFFADRARALPAEAGRQLRIHLFALHAIPLALNVALHLGAPTIHAYVAQPALYLFWSALHAVQTAAVRGFEPRAVGVCAPV
jgi:hypothetical protein